MAFRRAIKLNRATEMGVCLANGVFGGFHLGGDFVRQLFNVAVGQAIPQIPAPSP